MRKVFSISALMVLLGCGASVDGSSGGGASGPPCTLTVSGEASGSYSCTTRFAVWSGTTDIGTVMMRYGTTGETTLVIGATFTFAGVPRAGTFTEAEADAGVGARVTVTAGSRSWRATDGAETTGRYTLFISRVSSTKSLPDREIYAFSGSLDATLPPVPQTSATEDITLHAAF